MNEISGCNLVGLSSSLAILISQNLSSDDISILGAFFTTLGDNLALIATTQSSDSESKNINCHEKNSSE